MPGLIPGIRHWGHYWLQVMVNPRVFFADPNVALSIPARKFFFYTQLAGIVLPPLVVMVPMLPVAAAVGLWQVLPIVAVLFPLGLALFVFIACGAATLVALASHLTYHLAGSPTSFQRHFRQFLFLGAPEPVVIVAVAIWLMTPRFSAAGGAVLAVVLAVRVWALVAGFTALESVHPVPRRLLWAAYLPGFAAPLMLASVATVGLWFLASLVFMPGWD